MLKLIGSIVILRCLLDKYEILIWIILVIIIATMFIAFYKAKVSEYESANSNFDKISDSFYSDKGSVHELIFFLISSVTTTTFFAAFIFFFKTKGALLYDKIIFGKNNIIDLMEICNAFIEEKLNFSPMELLAILYEKSLIFFPTELLTFFPVELLIYVSLLLFLSMVIAYVLSITTIKLTISLINRKLGGQMASFIILWFLAFLVVILAITSFI